MHTHTLQTKYIHTLIHAYINTYTHTHLPGLSTLTKELTAATRIMQISSNELSTLLSNSAKCKQMKANTYAL